MHPAYRDRTENSDSPQALPVYGEETSVRTTPSKIQCAAYDGGENRQVNSKCTSICGNEFRGRSCAKIVMVKIYHSDTPEKAVKVYAMLDEHCNRTLVSTELLDTLGVQGPEVNYRLASCSGSYLTSGRRVDNFEICDIHGSVTYHLPTLLECSEMPRDVREIPTPEVARSFSHLRHIATELPEYDPNIPIGLLIGRDLLEAHHIEKQIVGPKDSPFAQKIGLGWVIVGDVCLDKRHPPDFEPVEITSFKTSIIQENRVSIFKPCSSNIKITDNSYYDRQIFDRRHDDDEVGLSTEDRQFLSLMSKKMVHDGGNWTAPLPFRENRPTLPNNFPIAEKRAKILDRSLQRSSETGPFCTVYVQSIEQQGS